MSLAELDRHCKFVIKVGKGAVGMFGAGIEDCLGGLLYFGFLSVAGCWPREVVVNYGVRIAVITLESSAISFQLTLETDDYDSNIALEVFDYAFNVEVDDGFFPGTAGDVGQRFPRIHKSILGKASCAFGFGQQVEGFFEVDVTI